MIARPLAAHSPRAVREMLLRHGWDQDRAEAAAGALEPVAILVEEVPAPAIESLVRYNQQLRIDLLTGEGWMLLAGPRSRFGAFARPWSLPPELIDLGFLIGGAIPAELPRSWATAGGVVPLDRPVILGILNLTPDSFSDGGRYLEPEAAVRHGEWLVEQGADILDLGGESTRPGASPVSPYDEMNRVLPVLTLLRERLPDTLISVDTVKAQVAEAALEAGAAIINDVSGLRLDPGLGAVVARHRAGFITMHSRGSVERMASLELAEYGDDPLAVIIRETGAAVERALAAGISPDHLVVDPGLGFAKTSEQSLSVLDQLVAFLGLGRPVLVGPSRKRFLGSATGQPVEERDQATAVACALAWERGARLFRVHDPGSTREALRLVQAVQGSH